MFSSTLIQLHKWFLVKHLGQQTFHLSILLLDFYQQYYMFTHNIMMMVFIWNALAMV